MRQALVARGRWRATVEIAEAYDPAASRIRLRLPRRARARCLGVRFAGAARRRRPSAGRVRAHPPRGRGGHRCDRGRARHPGGGAAPRRPSQGRGHAVGGRAPGRHRHRLHHRARPAVGGGERRRGRGRRRPSPAGVVLRTRAGAPVRDADLAEDERALARALEDAGHADARVRGGDGGRGTGRRSSSGSRPGRVTRVASVEVGRRAAPRTPARVAHELRLRPGGPYRLRDLAADRAALALAYRNDGYLSAEVTPEVELEDGGEARVRLVVDPRAAHHRRSRGGGGARPHAGGGGAARAAGARRASRSESTTSSRPSAGCPPSASSRPSPSSSSAAEAPGRRTLVIRVDEAPRTSRRPTGSATASATCVRGSVEVTRRNLFGMDRRLSAFVRMSFRGSRFLASYREPYLFGRRQELFVTAFRDEEDRDAVRLRALRRHRADRRGRSPRAGTSSCAQTYQEIRTYNVVEDCLALDRQFCPATVSGPSASLVERHPRRPAGPAARLLPPHRRPALASRARRRHAGEGVRAGSGYRLLGPARDPRPSPAASASDAPSARSRCCCRSPSGSSPAATTACAASAWTRCARRAATACCSAPPSCASTSAAASPRPPSPTSGNVYRLASDIDPLRPALHRRRRPALRSALGPAARSTGGTSSTAARAKARRTSTSPSAMPSSRLAARSRSWLRVRAAGAAAPRSSSACWRWWTAARCCSRRCAWRSGSAARTPRPARSRR